MASLLGAALLGIGIAAVTAGCSTAAPGTPVFDKEEGDQTSGPKVLRVTSAFGGAHRQLVVRDGVWFQSFANHVLMLDAQTGAVMCDAQLSQRGTTGPVVSLAVPSKGRLLAVLEDDAVVELDVSQPRTPRLVDRWGRAELGIPPRMLSEVDGELFVSGEGGVVRLSEATPEGRSFDEKGHPVPPVPPARLLDGSSVGCVVAAEGGPVACVGRRILRLADGSYLGAASMLLPLPTELGGGYAFVLQASEAAEVGLLGANFRERSSSAVRGLVRAIRVFEGRLIAISDSEVAVWKLDEKPGSGTISHGDGVQLGTTVAVSVKGARDVGFVSNNRYAVGGSFGRALYRYLPEGDLPGDTFFWSDRMPGRLDVCVSDSRRVLASGVEGSWMYLIGDKAELVDRDISSPDPQSARAELAWGIATCDEKREEVVIRVRDRAFSHRPSRPGLVSTLAAADGKLWIGHDRGIDVVSFDPVTGQIVEEARIILAGPIIAIYPNRVGLGVNYVARFDGFGMVRPVNESAAPYVEQGAVAVFETARPEAEGARK